MATEQFSDEERQARIERVVQFLCITIQQEGRATSAPKDKHWLVYHLVIEDNKTSKYDVEVCYASMMPEPLVGKESSCLALQQIAWNTQCYTLTPKGAYKIWQWLFSKEGHNPDLVLPFDGRQIEVTNHSLTKLEPDGAWDVNVYAELYLIIHRCVITYMTKLVNTSSRVLEICGGDGQVASRILEEARPYSYTMVDRNGQILTLAQQKLRTYIEAKRATVIAMDLSTADLTTSLQGPFDVVMGCGALTRKVVTQSTAERVIRQIHALLQNGGYLLLTGFEYSWIDSAVLRHVGFEVLNSYCRATSRHLYVAQKIG
ncbi:MAG: class I SAM-dependent methyltransferase [Verrucomicrobia bacterium]|nr:class I SAM-dependent methyltransferase [Verrucomicrobiota bacterium]